MTRREILGSLAAVFCGIALPHERETVWILKGPQSVSSIQSLPSTEALHEVLKSVYWDLRPRLFPTQFASSFLYQEPPH